MLFICAWYFLWLTIGDGPWWLTVLNRVVPYLFLPMPLYLVLLARKRIYGLMALLILPVAIFSFLYHPYLFPRYSKPAAQQAINLSVMSYNVLYSNLDYDAVSSVILTYHPDLAALQEVLPETMSALKDRLADEYPYSIHGTNEDYAVTAVFSRHPLSSVHVLKLGEDHRAVLVKADVNAQWITFASVHLRAYGLQWVSLSDMPKEIVRRTEEQNHQVEMLWEELQNEAGPVIIGCDCNSKETSRSYRMLDQWFDSAAYQVGWRFPEVELAGAVQDTNLQHIDFIWYRGALEPFVAYKIKDRGGSDHHPVLVLFDLR
jgi:endonuclease/exonuclease/phosphatase (EEP) superfamily protein YafD